MKFSGSHFLKTVLLACLVTGVNVAVAQEILKSGVTKWNPSRNIVLKGSTTFFDSFEMTVLTLKDKKKHDQAVQKDYEELIILKEGNLEITVNGESKALGPGSTAFLLPGENYAYSSSGSAAAVFYLLKFKSHALADEQRAQANGGSFLVDWNVLEMKKNERGGRRDFFNRPTATCQKFEMHVTTLNEGLPSHPPHTHAEEEIILMIKGDATMEIAGKYYNASPGDFIFVASKELHGIKNTGKGQCEYFAFQWK
ncbi:MAG: cupin [Marivirga sp.]|nr:cupin [Marivirga sp.]